MSEDDPFEELPEDREGDPFERLEGPEETAADDETDDESDVPAADASPQRDTEHQNDEPAIEEEFAGTEDEPAFEEEFAGTEDEPAFEEEFVEADDEPAFEEEFIDTGDPFGDTADPGATDGSDSGEPPDDDLFSEMDGREGDPFSEGESAFESVDVASVDADEVWESLDDDSRTETDEGTRHVEVSKHRFCEQCEHFASPPAARCTHDEAEIIEFLDMETVKLLDCPVVAEQRRLETEE